MNRRVFLSVAGVGAALLAGCAGTPTEPTDGGAPSPTQESTPTATMRGPRAGDDLPADETPGDGYPPAFGATPAARSIDTASFRTVSRDGQEVPLAPVETAYYWYARGEARFADARGQGQYERSHVYGAVSSPANNTMSDDPLEGWPEDDRIVCYCGCPHHLSSIRAADLLNRGYTEVYVIEEGFWETEQHGKGWVPHDYPVAGANVASHPASHVIEGRVDDRFAGETAWARHVASDQVEATEIESDGRFALHLYFSGVGLDEAVTVETPAYRVTAPLSDLTSDVVTA
jgi:rhodanese-related sulfurtransferase